MTRAILPTKLSLLEVRKGVGAILPEREERRERRAAGRKSQDRLLGPRERVKTEYCVEGKIKEHARRASTKPLATERPGENGIGNLMFIEGRNEVKTPFYLHVDDTVSVREARENGDWLFIFKVARETHLNLFACRRYCRRSHKADHGLRDEGQDLRRGGPSD